MFSTGQANISRGDILEALRATEQFLSNPDNRRKVAIESIRTYLGEAPLSLSTSFVDYDADIALKIAVRRSVYLGTSLCSEMDPVAQIITQTIELIQSYSVERNKMEGAGNYTLRRVQFVAGKLETQEQLGAPEEIDPNSG